MNFITRHVTARAVIFQYLVRICPNFWIILCTFTYDYIPDSKLGRAVLTEEEGLEGGVMTLGSTSVVVDLRSWRLV